MIPYRLESIGGEEVVHNDAVGQSSKRHKWT